MMDYIKDLNWVDFLIIFGLIRGAYIGYQEGIFKEILRLFLYLITIAILLTFSGILADYVGQNTFLGPESAKGLTVVAMGLVVYLGLKIVADLLLRWASLENNALLKFIGLFFGVMRWAGIMSGMFYRLNYRPFYLPY